MRTREGAFDSSSHVLAGALLHFALALVPEEKKDFGQFIMICLILEN
jgi:hypothetical protein